MIVEESLIDIIKRIPLLHRAKSTAAFSIQMLAESLELSQALSYYCWTSLSLIAAMINWPCDMSRDHRFALVDPGWLTGDGVAELRGVSSSTSVKAKWTMRESSMDWLSSTLYHDSIGLYYKGWPRLIIDYDTRRAYFAITVTSRVPNGYTISLPRL